MTITCEIEYVENPNGVYFSGQQLNGRVHLELNSPKTVRGVFVHLNGIGQCSWLVGKEVVSVEEDYLDEKIYLVGGVHGEVTLETGSYDYTFQCNLPPELPSSHEGEIGYIRYKASVTVDNPHWLDKSFEKPLTVIKQVTLPEGVNQEPVNAKIRTTFYKYPILCCFETGPVTLNAHIPSRGYTPGQEINIEFTVDNRSNQDLAQFKAQLVKKVENRHTKDSTHPRSEFIVAAEKSVDGCPIGTAKSYKIDLLVPGVPPTDTITSDIIQLEYCVEIIGCTHGLHKNVVAELPVIIGTDSDLNSSKYSVHRKSSKHWFMS